MAVVAERVIRSPDIERKDRVPPGQTLTQKWPVLHHGSVPDIDTARWTFTISGLVDRERHFSYSEFVSLPADKVLSDIHCVTGWSRLDNLWEGVSTAVIRELVNILPGARFVIVHCAAGFTTNLPLPEFFDTDVLFATKHNGGLLTPAHGYPLRLVVPGSTSGRAQSGSLGWSSWRGTGRASGNQPGTIITAITATPGKKSGTAK